MINFAFIRFLLKKKLRGLFRRPLPVYPEMQVMKDVAIPMRDGVRLMANIYLPVERPEAGVPAILAMTPYGKDELPERYELFKAVGINVGKIETSEYAVFEGPDPLFWVRNGYAVAHINARGMWNSEGLAYVFHQQNGLDFYDAIEWVALQPWCSGKIGLSGVSYLAWSQWMAASLNPPHLCAIAPWEGFIDMYRDLAYHGGIREDGFIGQLSRRRFRAHYNKKYGLEEDLAASAKAHPLIDAYWLAKLPFLENITVPALVCASWSDQGLHTRGSFLGFSTIRSREKWLYTHGRKKWETYYSDEVLRLHLGFFDHFLRAVPNEFPVRPRVRLEIRKTYADYEVTSADQWPLASVTHRQLYLSGSGALDPDLPPQPLTFVYDTDSQGKVSFAWRFDTDTVLAGGMKLKLWVASKEAPDMDLFVAIRKIAASGEEVHFSGYNGIDYDIVARGWLKVSHRELDPHRSTVERPFQLHLRERPLVAGEIVPVEIEILPSATLFKNGSVLLLEVMGHEPVSYNTLRHAINNKGKHWVYGGGQYDSYLLAPIHYAKPSPDWPGRP